MAQFLIQRYKFLTEFAICTLYTIYLKMRYVALSNERKETVMEKAKLDRISFLYKKSKEEGLTSEERQEQAELRKEYIETIKKNFRSTLDSIEYKD